MWIQMWRQNYRIQHKMRALGFSIELCLLFFPMNGNLWEKNQLEDLLSLTVIVSVPPDATPLPSPPRSRTVVPAKTGIGHSAEWSFIYWKALAPRYYTMELNSPKWLGSMSQRLFIPQYNTYPWVVPADQYIRIEVHWVSWLSGVVLKPQLWGGGAMRQLESPLVWTSSSRLAPPVPGRFWFSPSTVSQHLWVSSLGWADELPQVSDRTGFIAAGCRNIRHNNCGIWRLSQTSDWYVKVRTLLRCVVDGEWECRGCL